MAADERSDVDPLASHDASPLRPRLFAALVALGLGVTLALIIVGWWKRGGPRRAVKDLAEEGAVSLVDALVDQVFPAA